MGFPGSPIGFKIDLYNYFSAIFVIYQYRNNIRFLKKIPIYSSSKHQNKSHHWKFTFTGNLKLLTKICAKGKQIPALYMKLQQYENLLNFLSQE